MNARSSLAAAAARRASLTFEDMLLFLMRRLVAPAAISTAATAALIFLLTGGIGIGGRMEQFFIYLLVPGALYGAAILFLGIPAGYLVARLHWGFVQSLGLLMLVGYCAVLLPGLVLGGVLAFPLGFFGAFAAGVWTFLNADLFREANKGA